MNRKLWVAGFNIILAFLFVGAVICGQISEADPTEINLTLTDADTEYSVQLTGEVTSYSFLCSTAADIRYSWTTGKVATPTAPYQILKSGTVDSFTDIRQTDVTLYFAGDSGGEIVMLQFNVQP